MPDWVAACVGLLIFAQGFVLGGVIFARTNIWDGARSVYSLGYARPRVPQQSPRPAPQEASSFDRRPQADRS